MNRPRFGEIAVEMGFLAEDQVVAALADQSADDREGQPRRPLGIICIQKGFLTFEQVVAVLGRQDQASREGALAEA